LKPGVESSALTRINAKLLQGLVAELVDFGHDLLDTRTELTPEFEDDTKK
jgi:hypothetical protein